MPNKTGTERGRRGHVGKAWAIRCSSRDPAQYVLNGEAGRRDADGGLWPRSLVTRWRFYTGKQKRDKLQHNNTGTKFGLHKSKVCTDYFRIFVRWKMMFGVSVDFYV